MRPVSRALYLSLIVGSLAFGDTLYVTNENNNLQGGTNSYVSAYDLASRAFLGNLVPSTPYALPDAITIVDPLGNIYVADAGANRVVEFNSSFQQTAVYNTQPLNYGQVSPSGLAVDPAGNVYISNLDGSIQKISNGMVTTIGNVGGTARGIAYNPANGLLYVTTQYPGDVYTLPTNGGTASLFASGIGSGNLRGLAFANGNLYVSDTTGSHTSGVIYEFIGRNSLDMVQFASGLDGPNASPPIPWAICTLRNTMAMMSTSFRQ